MACPAILTGDQFVSRVMGHIDCQAAYLGSFGWQALGQPGSMAATVMTGLLTLFVALFGIRLLFGPALGARDVVGDVLKIGIVLTLAFSWPAFQTVIHDVVIEGPGELAASVGAPVMPEGASLVSRLQEADNSILELVELGTGRQSGQYLDRETPGGTFGAQGLQDENSFGMARLFFLAGLLASFGLLRIIAGFLLAMAPLAAGMLLFEPTRGLFSGWLRGLVLALVGGAAVSVVAAGELAILSPWLTDALRLRGLGYATPSAPTELFALTLGFAAVKLGTIWIIARIAFTRGWVSMPTFPDLRAAASEKVSAQRAEPVSAFSQSRYERIVDSVETQLRREQTGYSEEDRNIRFASGSAAPRDGERAEGIQGNRMVEPLGSSWRRVSHRHSRAAARRDGGK